MQDRPRGHRRLVPASSTQPQEPRRELEANPLAPWELRIGKLRVYFDVEDKPVRVVKIRTVGIKERDRVLIGGEEIELR